MLHIISISLELIYTLLKPHINYKLIMSIVCNYSAVHMLTVIKSIDSMHVINKYKINKKKCCYLFLLNGCKIYIYIL